MKVLSKVALFTALVVFSACSVAETPFKVYEDKDKSFKQIEKFLAGKSTKWEAKEVQNNGGANFDAYTRVYTYENENFATAGFSYDKEQERAQSFYQTYTHKKISVAGYTATYTSYSGGGGAGTDISGDITGYTLYELTAGPSGSAATPSPRAARKEYYLIKIDGSKLYGVESVDVDTTAKTIDIRGDASTFTPMVFNKL